MEDIINSSYFLLLPLLFLVIFLISWFIEKRRLLNGLLFNLFLISLLAGLTGFGLSAHLTPVTVFVGFIGLLLILFVMFGIYALIFFLFWNARQVIHREGHSLANLLTLILACALTAFMLITFFSGSYPEWAKWTLNWLTILGVYVLMTFANFLTVTLLYQFNKPKLNQDFIIVLGAGLLDGKRVSRLLANRIDKALTFYQRQKSQTTAPKIIMSGGKGDDEHLSEAEAMGTYAVENGLDPADLLLEDQSRDTTQNMLFSKKIIDRAELVHPKVIFTSNNFHIFRASLDALHAGLKADGLGAKTAFYYLPNAYLREFAAILVMNKRRHLISVAVITLFYLLMFFVNMLS